MLNKVHRDIIVSVENMGGLNMASIGNREIEVGFGMLFLPYERH